MYLLRLYNDLHNEKTIYDIPVLPNEKETVLSLAGDIYDRKHLMEWLRPLSARFKAVVCVLGNHDFWGGDVDKIPRTIAAWLDENPLPNVHVLFDQHVIIDGTMFFGGTMWTDYNRKDPLTMISSGPFLDYREIRYDNYGKRWSTKEAYRRHQLYKERLLNTLANYKGGRVVVLSHMAPCELSSDPKYINDRVHNGFYYSDMSNLILDHPQIVLWHHGHMHTKSLYMLGDHTMIACNPRGYVPHEPVEDFDEHMVIDLDAMPSL